MFDLFIEEILRVEGGYVNDPNDSGGETNYGITERVARRYGYDGDMRQLPKSMAKQIYYERYWKALHLDEIENVCPALCMKLGDIGVNMGVKQAGFFLQRLLNVMNNRERYYSDIVVDGFVGPVTIATLQQFLSLRGGDGETVLIRALNCMQGMFYISLAERREKDETFIYGWLLNRID